MLWGKIKTYLIMALSLALPLFYLFGKRSGRTELERDVLKDEIDAAQKVSKFYKAMAEHEQDDPVTDRSSLLERLRRDGL